MRFTKTRRWARSSGGLVGGIWTFGTGCLVFGSLVCSCGKNAGDTGASATTSDACVDDLRDPAVALGTGAGSTFVPLEDGDSVGLAVAPQGGFGVSVRAQTVGLQVGAVDVRLETEINGANVGSFTDHGVIIYCQDSGDGLLWGVVVGFDSTLYHSNDDLLALDDQTVDLVVTVTDASGRSAQGRSSVVVAVGAR